MKVPVPPEEAGEVERVREVTLYFASSDANSLVPEHRQIVSSNQVLENLRRVIESLIGGPGGDGIPTIPSSARLRSVFIHDKVAHIDFSPEIVEDFSGGTASEYMLISSLVQTICANFHEVEAVAILVEGNEIDTIGGHLLINQPLRPEDWR
jgi:germination protein M